MQINDVVICAWSGSYQGITTGREYTVIDVKLDHGIKYISIKDDLNRVGTYDAARFMKRTDRNEQVLENVING